MQDIIVVYDYWIQKAMWLPRPSSALAVSVSLRLFYFTSICFVNCFVHLSVIEKPKVKNRPFYKEVKMDGAFQIHLDVEGVPPPGYQWFRNGYPLEGENNQVLVIDKMDRSLAGTYSCEVKNIAGSFLWLEATIAVPD